MRSGDYHRVLKKLHDEYGPVVQIGPNIVDLDYPELIKTLYSTDDRWRKVGYLRSCSPLADYRDQVLINSRSSQTEFYHNNSIVVNGKIVYSIFSTTDPVEHARTQRPIAKHFSFSSVLALEPHMDKVINDLCSHLERRFTDGPQKGKPCDLGEWIAFCLYPSSLDPFPPQLEYFFFLKKRNPRVQY